ncbi:unnamed protein product [Allacma fusca]|uniref:Uncharacterized protein n=1 Tax=Allacma fusca TaxID=39272 RepID=A0A8J2K4T3_9HEXA|nr:unnamed protein product [Allacma fusca]
MFVYWNGWEFQEFGGFLLDGNDLVVNVYGFIEMEELAKHGTMLPPDMLGLTDEQIVELKKVDTWGESCIPSGGFRENKDPIGRRNGKQPGEKMQELIARSVGEVKAAIDKKQVDAKICMTERIIKDQLDILRGTCMIVYPMNLPPHDPIRLEFENKEDLAGTQDSLMVLNPSDTELWFCGKQVFPGKKLGDFIGTNEKTKVVIKLQKKGQGAPGREPVMTEAEQKNFMAYAYKKQEEAKVSRFNF